MKPLLEAQARLRAFHNPIADNAKITILVDNQATGGLDAEHGLSLWIEVAGRRILFDTGQETALPRNAARLGIALHTAEMVVLSHGHYDHTGGLALVVQQAPAIQLYGHPSVSLPRYAIRGGVTRDIGIPEPAKMALQCLSNGRIHWTTGATEIAPGVGITGSIPRLTDSVDLPTRRPDREADLGGRPHVGPPPCGRRISRVGARGFP